ncbi:MAG TPA: TonB family protein [Candidatus Baltobacteraceae bacterium]
MTACNQAEVLAGAIALGEATDAERQTYRGHVATCSACLRANGGEHEIERTMARVGQARDGETWDPDLTALVREKMNGRKRLLRAGLTVAGACIAISLAFNLAMVAGLGRIAPSFADPLVLNYDGQRIVLEHRSTAALPQATAAPRMVVEHNVVTLTRQPAAVGAVGPRAPQATIPSVQQAPRTVASTASTLAAAQKTFDDTPIWRRGSGGGGGSIAVTQTTTSVSQTIPRLDRQTDSIVVAPAYTIRAPEPIGGETALTPQPAPIAYAQNASGTSVFEVQIDERGVPTKCAITKSSGFLSLDDAVCRAAMKARYSPKLVNGRPVPGSYTDAFTFRSSGNGEGL